MTLPGRGWNELSLSEDPAVAVLAKVLGYSYVAPEVLAQERESEKDVVLGARLRRALKRLNPWLSEDGLHKVVRGVTARPSLGLLDASERMYVELTYGASAEQDGAGGKKGRTVRFFDFEKPLDNEFLVTRQYACQGSRARIIPDVVVFVNGLPLVVLECKSPTLGDKWKAEAIQQLLRYQEIGAEYRERGMPRLFETVQILVGCCGQDAVYGTVTTPQRYFAEWKTAYPRTDAQLEKALGRTPTPQDVLLCGMLDRANILDLIRNFVVFERDEKTGKTLRKLARYQQFAAVNKALARAQKSAPAAERGGVVWHTQGSGKSLTMLWLALKLRRDPRHENPTLVLVTDRVDLDEQITKTFQACGFPNPVRADSVRELRSLLSGPGGGTILTTVHKFQELAGKGTAGKKGAGRAGAPTALTAADNVFVLTDEAHRTQYGSLAANMRAALPNATFFGFTGTPIDKKDRSTLSTFGSYIDTYTIEQAVKDGATVPIFYEGRLPELRIIGSSLDALFERVFADRSPEEREAIKRKYAQEEAIAGAPRRIEAICLDLLDHYTKFIRPNGFKAQIVVRSREIAARYKDTLDRMNAPESAVIISATNDDTEQLAKHHTDKEQRKALIARFLKASDPLCFLIVCDMLLTGFDAPIEQVMYLDSPLKEHTLLQAIARVNRTEEQKEYGLIVDYWGVSEALEEALAIFVPEEIQGALTPKADQLPQLEVWHRAAMRFFLRLPANKRDDLEACLRIIEPEDVRTEFNAAFRRFSKSLDLLLPDPRALQYVPDFRWLGKLRQVAAVRFRDSTLDISDCEPKVRQLIDEAVVADGISILVQKVNLLTPEFEQRLAALKSDEAKASEMEHAIRDEIHVKLDENPAFYSSLRERLEQIILDRKARRIDEAKQLELLTALRREVARPAEAAQQLGLSEHGFAIYGFLCPEHKGNRDAAKIEQAQLIEEAILPQTEIIDWQQKEDVQKEMRKRIKRQLRAAGYPDGQLDGIAEGIVDLLRKRVRA